MKSNFRPSTADDLPSIRRLLARAFGVSMDACFLDPATLAWKYWEPREDWTEPRGYVIERQDEIVAHAGVWPVEFGAAPGSAIRGIQMIDWASAKESPGAGLGLVQKFAGMFDFIYSVGGSAATCKVLPAFGFAEYARQWKGGCPLRPVQQMLTHQNRNWKLGPRFIRNSLWMMRGGHRAQGWDVREIQAGEMRTGAASSGGQGEAAQFSPRSAEFFAYLDRCPAAAFSFYRMTEGGRERGCFALSLVRGQARVAGIWLEGPGTETWAAAYSLVRRAACEVRGANEVVTSGTESGDSRAGAEAAGFRTSVGPVVYMLDRGGKLSLAPGFQFQSTDYDGAFLDGGTPGYWS